MDLQLLISLDSMGDSFIKALGAPSTFQSNLRKDLIRCWFTSSQWMETESSSTRASLKKLSDAILLKLNNRQLDSVDICIILYARNSESTKLFLPLYQHFDHFLRVVTTRRIYVIYPRSATELNHFRKNFTELLEKTSSTAYSLREVHLLIAPEGTSSQSIHWPESEIESYCIVNLMDQCRARIDEMLTNSAHPFCNSSYRRIIFDRDTWQTYYVLRSKLDLTTYSLITSDSTLNVKAKKFVEENSLIERCYKVEFPPLSMGALNIDRDPEMDRTNALTLPLYKEFIMQQNEAFEKIRESEFADLETLDRAYRKCLIEVLNEDKKSLNGLGRALYLHNVVLGFTENPEFHQKLINKYIVIKQLVPAINHIARCINALFGHHELGMLESKPAETTIDLKLEQIQTAMDEAEWTDWRLMIKTIFSGILEKIMVIHKMSLPVTVMDKTIETAIYGSFGGLDGELDKLKKELEEKKQSLEALETEFTMFKKIRKRSSYRERKQTILNGIESIDRRYNKLIMSANIYMEAISLFLTLCGHMMLISEMLKRTQNKIKQTANILNKSYNILTVKHGEFQYMLDHIPEGPVRDGVELSYLSKSNMEALYQQFDPPEIGNYIDTLLSDSDEIGQTWGQWALVHLDVYLTRLDSYCHSRYRSVPQLDLPTLMFRYFKKDLVARLKYLVQFASETILPLCEKNLAERWFQQMFAFPDDVIGQLKEFEEKIVYENHRISLEKSQITYVNNADRMRLDLNFMLCGFRPEDYLYWDAFENSQEDA